LDNAATTAPLPEVVDLIREDLSDPNQFGNPSSLHRLGMYSENRFSVAMNDIGKQLHVSADELILTSGGSESINTALLGFADANPRLGKHIISTKAEHMASLGALRRLEQMGYEITWVPTQKNGEPEWSFLEKSIRNDTLFITLTHVNNETGATLPVDRLVSLRNARNRKTAIHLDCVQSLGKLPINISALNIELASFSGHKIHCVKGVGLLYKKKGLRMSPLICGGGQQRGFRSGTESPWLARALALAIRKATERLDESLLSISECKRILCDKITCLGGVVLSPENGSPYILNAALGSIRSEILLHALEEHDIYISTVSACASKKNKTSHVLSAMDVAESIAKNAIRISFSRFTTEKDCRDFCQALEKTIKIYGIG